MARTQGVVAAGVGGRGVVRPGDGRRRRVWLAVGWFVLAIGLVALLVVALLAGWSGD
jgi:hypothetical protein